MRRATFDAILAQQAALKKIEEAARNYAAAARWITTSPNSVRPSAKPDERDALVALRKALYNYDGLGWEQTEEVVESLQNIANELEQDVRAQSPSHH